jgi:hypothetical protein
MYIEIENEQIIKQHTTLPNSYKNISNFFALESEQLADLSWSGNPGIKFYPYVEQRPEIPDNSVLVGPTYTIDHENHRVLGSFEIQQAPPHVTNIPRSISARQIRMWLVKNGYSLAQVEAQIESIEDPLQRDLIRVEWEYAPYIERNHPWLVPLAQSLGLSEQQIDQAFIEASVI